MFLPKELEFDSLIGQVWKDYQDGDKFALDNIYDILMPFCLRVSSKTCGQYIGNEDEEASIARMAVLEALGKYDPAQGAFRVYLGQVIRNRIIDYKRKEKKRKVIHLPLLSKDRGAFPEEVDDSFYESIIDDLARKQEIEEFGRLLAEYNITFEELVRVSPRQAKTREITKKIALIIADDENLGNYLTERKALPIKLLEEKWNVNRKLVDRYRKFIIAAALIHKYEFSYLKTYVLPVAKEGNYGW